MPLHLYKAFAGLFYAGFVRGHDDVLMLHHISIFAGVGLDLAVAFGADLIMCGHTHRGQIFPANLIAAWTHGAGRNYGHTVEGNTDVIVTSGVGYWGPPMRTASDAEVVLIQTDLQG